MIISLIETAAIALHVESGIPLDRCRLQTNMRAVFFSMMRDPVARAIIIAVARGQSALKTRNKE